MIKLGSEGVEVANWQRFLVSRGYIIDVDGIFGRATEIATKDFQKRNELDIDGKVGNKTYAVAKSMRAKLSSSDKPNKDIPPRLEKVHPKLVKAALDIIDMAKSAGFELIVTQGLRTFAEQDKLFNKRPKVTNARGGQSMHNYGLAIDFAFKVKNKITWEERFYENIGHWADVVGLEWGGKWRFKDMPHVQLPNLPNYQVLRRWYKNGGLDEVWKNIDRR